eukprot:gi/632960277/ref/XP_007896100.1/ PREDICTED: uncharacterized protein LOC103181439 [Callorhinchus milii]
MECPVICPLSREGPVIEATELGESQGPENGVYVACDKERNRKLLLISYTLHLEGKSSRIVPAISLQSLSGVTSVRMEIGQFLMEKWSAAAFVFTKEPSHKDNR